MSFETEIITIATHDGNFHADEIFAIATLKLYFSKIEQGLKFEIKRTRDTKEINFADFKIDVGFKYDPDQYWYDHHQKSGAGVRENGIPYSSFGLIWKHFGQIICQNKTISNKIDEDLVQKIDGVDDGYNLDGLEKSNFVSLNYAINSLNPTWMDSSSDITDKFNIGIDFAYHVIEGAINKISSEVYGRQIVEDSIKNHSGLPYIILPVDCPFRERVLKEPNILYVITPKISIQNQSPTAQTWNIYTVEESKGNSRKLFPEEWGGLEGDELERVTGVIGSIFCHKNRFIASADSKEAAIELAIKSSDYKPFIPYY